MCSSRFLIARWQGPRLTRVHCWLSRKDGDRKLPRNRTTAYPAASADKCVPHRCRVAGCQPLFVEPDVFEASVVVDAADHHRQPLQLRLPARSATGVEQDRPRIVLRQLLLDLPDLLPPFAEI